MTEKGKGVWSLKLTWEDRTIICRRHGFPTNSPALPEKKRKKGGRAVRGWTTEGNVKLAAKKHTRSRIECHAIKEERETDKRRMLKKKEKKSEKLKRPNSKGGRTTRKVARGTTRLCAWKHPSAGCFGGPLSGYKRVFSKDFEYGREKEQL